MQVLTFIGKNDQNSVIIFEASMQAVTEIAIFFSYADV